MTPPRQADSDEYTVDIRDHILMMEAIMKDRELHTTISRIVHLIVRSLRDRGMVLLFGCGGSAADAQHIAAEFVNKMRVVRPPLAALALTTDTSVLTAISNDDTFDHVFRRQVEALATQHDVVIGISTSGQSPSVLQGLEAGRACGAATVLFTGGWQRDYTGIADCVIRVPSTSTPRIQEAHITLAHIICTHVEREFLHGPD